MESQTIYCKLIAKETDLEQYTTYVFEVLDGMDSKYCMCVRYPNWEEKIVNIGDIGYLHFKEVIAGKDKYWNGSDFIPYNYSNWQFMKFIPKVSGEMKVN